MSPAGVRRRSAVMVFLGLAALPALLVSAADVIDELKLDRQDAIDSAYQAFYSGRYAFGVPLAAFKALPPARQAGVVSALGSFVRGYVESAEFRSRYAEDRQAAQPRPPAPARPGQDLVAEEQQKLTDQIAETEANVKKAPADQQEMYRTIIKSLQEARTALGSQTAMFDMAEKMRYEAELAEYQGRLEDPKRLPEDSNQLVARRLKEFLELTAGVDFNARLTTTFGRKRFVDPDLEAKPAEWKMCFRAGRPAVDAARAFAQAWLGEIGTGR